MKAVTPIRLILTVALMVVVWFHAHWSVALSLTLMSIAIEIGVLGKNPQAGRWDTR